jgi:hypothetical protein
MADQIVYREAPTATQITDLERTLALMSHSPLEARGPQLHSGTDLVAARDVGHPGRTSEWIRLGSAFFRVELAPMTSTPSRPDGSNARKG